MVPLIDKNFVRVQILQFGNASRQFLHTFFLQLIPEAQSSFTSAATGGKKRRNGGGGGEEGEYKASLESEVTGYINEGSEG